MSSSVTRSDRSGAKASRYVRESTKVVGNLLGTGEIGKQTTEGWEQTISTLATVKLLQKPIPPEEVFINLQ
jgi:hypothetical protein